MNKPTNDHGHGLERRWSVRKFASDADHAADKPYEVAKFGGNLLLNEGINELFTVLCSSGGTKFDNTNAYLGVGDSSTAESASQTDLQAASNKFYKVMDATYPTYGTSQQVTFRTTFASGEANFAWAEFTVANGSSGTAKNLNRKVSAQGTKTAGQTWELTLVISLS